MLLPSFLHSDAVAGVHHTVFPSVALFDGMTPLLNVVGVFSSFVKVSFDLTPTSFYHFIVSYAANLFYLLLYCCYCCCFVVLLYSIVVLFVLFYGCFASCGVVVTVAVLLVFFGLLCFPIVVL